MRQTSKALLCAGLLPTQERQILFFCKGMQGRLKLFNRSDGLRLQKSLSHPRRRVPGLKQGFSCMPSNGNRMRNSERFDFIKPIVQQYAKQAKLCFALGSCLRRSDGYCFLWVSGLNG